MIDFTPELRAEALEILAGYNYGPIYTPPIEGRPTINLPGNNGGANWTGGAYDPESGLFYIASRYGPTTTELIRPDPARSNMKLVGKIQTWVPGPPGLQLIKPPYGRITAIDLNTGDHAWQVAHGDGPINHPLLKEMNLAPMGDSQRGYLVATKTLLFVAQGDTRRGRLPSDDPNRPNFRAFDKATGEVVWEFKLPGPVAASPMTYMAGGKQYLVVGVSQPSRLVALSLP